MTRTIKVAHLGRNWRVTSGGIETEMVFQSGATAEAAARLLANQTVKRGRTVQTEIFLKDGALAGRLQCPPLPDRLLPANRLYSWPDAARTILGSPNLD